MKDYKFKFWRFTSWLITQIIAFGLAGLWLIYHYPIAENVFLFIFWLSFVIAWFVFLGTIVSKEVDVPIKERGRSAPAMLSVTMDFLLAIFLAAFGHWFLASCWIVQTFIEQSWYATGKITANK